MKITTNGRYFDTQKKYKVSKSIVFIVNKNSKYWPVMNYYNKLCIKIVNSIMKTIYRN